VFATRSPPDRTIHPASTFVNYVHL
jgi:hypothetical protein